MSDEMQHREEIETEPAFVEEVVHVEQEPTIDIGEEPHTSSVPTIPQLLIAIAILGGILGYPHIAPFIPAKTQGKTSQNSPLLEVSESAGEVLVEEMSYSEVSHSTPFENISLEADAAYVWDVNAQRVLFSKNAQAQLPLASLTKLMTALVAYEIYGEHATVPITLDAIREEGENGFEDGETWTAKNLLDFTLITSSNDGAAALAAAAGKALDSSRDSEEVFLEAMNKKAHEIGLSQTYFTNPTGLDASEAESGSYGSARDMAFLMEYIIEHYPQILENTDKRTHNFSNKEGEQYTAENTNPSVESFTNLLGSKTGYTLLAGGNLVISFDVGLNHPIIVSVLGSTREGRFTDVKTLAQHTESVFNTQP